MTKPTLKTIILFFDDYKFNDEPVVLDECTTINNVKIFIDTNVSYLLANSGKALFSPYYSRLLKLYLILKQ